MDYWLERTSLMDRKMGLQSAYANSLGIVSADQLLLAVAKQKVIRRETHSAARLEDFHTRKHQGLLWERICIPLWKQAQTCLFLLNHHKFHLAVQQDHQTYLLDPKEHLYFQLAFHHHTPNNFPLSEEWRRKALRLELWLA